MCSYIFFSLFEKKESSSFIFFPPQISVILSGWRFALPLPLRSLKPPSVPPSQVINALSLLHPITVYDRGGGGRKRRKFGWMQRGFGGREGDAMKGV